MANLTLNNLGTQCSARGARETVNAIREGTLTAREALEDCLQAVDTFNGEINAVVSLDVETARASADETDGRLAAGMTPRALEGLPMTIKEVFDLEGLPTSWGDPSLHDRYPRQDSGVARDLKQAGAIIFGKTNLPDRMADWETDNRQWGPTRNPWNLEYSAGGSSGGSAAAVAAGLSPVCIGSDMGGSIRMPAHYCGVYGLKPSWNLISMTGHSLQDELRVPDLCVAGPIARKTEDLSLLLSTLAQPDPLERAGWQVNLPAARTKPLSELRIGCLLDHADCPIDAPYLDAMAQFVEQLRAAGVTIDKEALPDLDFARATEVMNLLARSETSTMLDDKTFASTLEDARAPGHRGQNARGNALLHRDWLRLHEERIGYRQKWSDFFEKYDAFLSPAAASCAPPLISGIDSVLERTVLVNGKAIEMTDQHFWAAIPTLPYLPAITVPIGLSSTGLPAGIQLVGPSFQDHSLIAMAEQFAQIT